MVRKGSPVRVRQRASQRMSCSGTVSQAPDALSVRLVEAVGRPFGNDLETKVRSEVPLRPWSTPGRQGPGTGRTRLISGAGAVQSSAARQGRAQRAAKRRTLRVRAGGATPFTAAAAASCCVRSFAGVCRSVFGSTASLSAVPASLSPRLSGPLGTLWARRASLSASRGSYAGRRPYPSR
jgi:hypothetical protein